MSEVVESELIRRYKPKLNVAKMSNWDGLEFKEPSWKLFNHKDKCTKKKIIQQSRKNTISVIKQMQLETYRLMAEYYCSKLLENISKAKETELFYEITIPLRNKTDYDKYCIPLYIEVNNENIHAGLTLCHCIRYYNDEENVTYKFKKNSIFEEFFGVKPGLTERIQYAQNMFLNKYICMQTILNEG